jgi:hypothetical protein
MAYACKHCILTKGLKGSEIGSLPQTLDELADHMEKEHHMPVTRDGESKEQAEARFLAKHPEAKECSECREARAPWTAVG